MKAKWYALGGINPEPWTASEASTGTKHGKIFTSFHKSPQLRNYQEAIREEMLQQYGEYQPSEHPMTLWFYLWRDLPEGIAERKVHAHVADATNLQKALEDALQGILYVNDTQVQEVHTKLVRQRARTLPRILIGVSELVSTADWANEKVKTLLDEQKGTQQPDTYVPPDDLF